MLLLAAAVLPVLAGWRQSNSSGLADQVDSAMAADRLRGDSPDREDSAYPLLAAAMHCPWFS
jgi:hypothetical protein